MQSVSVANGWRADASYLSLPLGLVDPEEFSVRLTSRSLEPLVQYSNLCPSGAATEGHVGEVVPVSPRAGVHNHMFLVYDPNPYPRDVALAMPCVRPCYRALPGGRGLPDICCRRDGALRQTRGRSKQALFPLFSFYPQALFDHTPSMQNGERNEENQVCVEKQTLVPL